MRRDLAEKPSSGCDTDTEMRSCTLIVFDNAFALCAQIRLLTGPEFEFSEGRSMRISSYMLLGIGLGLSGCALEEAPVQDNTDDSVQELTSQTNWFQSARSPRHTAYNPTETSLTAARIKGLKVLWQKSLGSKKMADDAEEASMREAGVALGKRVPQVVQQGSRLFVNSGEMLALSTNGAILWRSSDAGDKCEKACEKQCDATCSAECAKTVPPQCEKDCRRECKPGDKKCADKCQASCVKEGLKKCEDKCEDKCTDKCEKTCEQTNELRRLVRAPAYTHGVVYGTGVNGLFALESSNGDVSDSEKPLGGVTLTNPLTKWWEKGVGSVFVVVRDGARNPARLRGFDTYSFTPTFDVALPWVAGPVADPAAANERVFVSGERTAAFDGRTGALAWSSPVGFNGPAGKTGPAVLLGRVIVRSGATKVAALDEKTGARLWEASTSAAPAGGFAVTFDRVYVASNSRSGKKSGVSIEAFALGSGAKQFGVFVEGADLATDLAVAADVLYFGTENGTLNALSSASGAFLTSKKLSGKPSTPAIANGRLYVATDDDKVFALGL
jgi:outer membrane protein assembly factor BamB